MDSRKLAESWLSDLVALPSVTGEEEAALAWVEAKLIELGYAPQRLPLGADALAHAAYRPFEPPSDWQRANLVVKLPGEGAPLLLNTHLDTVPAAGWEEAFTPRIEGDRLIGRGACDAKGQVVTLLLVAAALKERGLALERPLEFHFVIEEEVGGNGALALALASKGASGCVVLEPTGLNIHPSNRGALWFKYRIEGRSVHMGRIQEGVNAIEKAWLLAESLQAYWDELLEASRGYPGYEQYEAPVQVNLGTISGGDWPSMVAGWCELEGGVGFLPSKTLAEVEADLRGLIASHPDGWLRDHTTVTFDRLRNEAFAFPLDHPLALGLHQAARAAGGQGEITGWNVSCDARLYAKVAEVPTVVFGAGDVAEAHSAGESIALPELLLAAEALTEFVLDWCGVRSS